MSGSRASTAASFPVKSMCDVQPVGVDQDKEPKREGATPLRVPTPTFKGNTKACPKRGVGIGWTRRRWRWAAGLQGAAVAPEGGRIAGQGEAPKRYDGGDGEEEEEEEEEEGGGGGGGAGAGDGAGNVVVFLLL